MNNKRFIIYFISWIVGNLFIYFLSGRNWGPGQSVFSFLLSTTFFRNYIDWINKKESVSRSFLIFYWSKKDKFIRGKGEATIEIITSDPDTKDLVIDIIERGMKYAAEDDTSDDIQLTDITRLN